MANATQEETCRNVQAHILRASKFKDKPRNWSLFFFFRILQQAEFDVMIERMEGAMTDDDAAKRELWQDFAETTLVNAGLVKQRVAEDSGSEPDRPADAFLHWLKAIVSADNSGIKDTADLMLSLFGSKSGRPKPPEVTSNVPWLDPTDWMPSRFENGVLDVSFVQSLVSQFAKPDDYAKQLESIINKLKTAAPAPEGRLGPLVTVTLCEIMRQCAPAWRKPDPGSKEPSVGIVRGEGAEELKLTEDCTPNNVAFTYSGLTALKMDGDTLISFPDAFKEGMAARADRLHDTGPSAPETWEGELGLPGVHGYFMGSFDLSEGNATKESFWKAMRRDVEAFNNPISELGQILRFGFRILFRVYGMEILHIELGQFPYEVEDDTVKDRVPRIEHFGFRDGLSQPFVDMKLGAPPPGGGTPNRDGTWTPVAPGEILLSEPDEDNQTHRLPINKTLRLGSTFLVFRKLEQDVPGFRAFLDRCCPGDHKAQEALAAQFVGRRQNGAPLVSSSANANSAGQSKDAALNNFRYAADDPLGKQCPLGAHIRRVNPRDIGGRREARRHRILRRGISYGGPLLKEGAPDDGEKRGLLFVAANSRIDLQFEVIQGHWINGGEFLGQSGLGRCPLTANHSGATSDSFLKADAAAPITGLPRFVTTRGGDYFFAPGIEALREISNKGRFPPDAGEIPDFSMGDAATPTLLDPKRLRKYGQTILSQPDLSADAAVHVELPSPGGGFCFIGQYRDVAYVLKNGKIAGEPKRLEFSVRQYRDHGRNITRGSDLLVGTEEFGSTATTRKRLGTILERAWSALAGGYEGRDMADVVRGVAQSATEIALRRTDSARRIDLIKDLATPATYAIIREVYGVQGPDWLTEISAAMRFARQHVGDLPSDWLAKLAGREPDDRGLATLQTWSVIILADLIGNAQSLQHLQAFSRQAGSEMLNHLDHIILAAQASLGAQTPPPPAPKTLVQAFIRNAKDDGIRDLYKGFDHGGNWHPLYFKDVSTLLLEIVGTTMASIPLTFGAVMEGLLKYQIDLNMLIRKPGICPSRIIYEAERLNPVLEIRMRYCEVDTQLPSGARVKAGERVACMIRAANMDKRVFDEPFRLTFDPKKRDIKKYLLFNEEGNARRCWGGDRVAMVVLQECLMAASRLQGLREVAGKGGDPPKLFRVKVSLPVRFTRVAAASPVVSSRAPSSTASCQTADKSPAVQ